LQYLDQALEALGENPTDESLRLLPNSPHQRLALTYLVAVLEGDRSRASRVILDAIDRPEKIRDIYSHVLMPAQQELGRLWLNGEINVAEEHFGSYTTRMVMSQILSLAAFDPPNGKTVLTAAVAGNHVDIGLHAVADFFEMAGWQTIRLGADVPTRDLVESITCFDVDLLALSAALSVQLETVKSAIEAVRSEFRENSPKILVGGLAFANSGELSVHVGADGYAPDLDGAVRLGSQLVGLAPDDVAA
jgi:methanogenic corrinoid protein MtbC1